MISEETLRKYEKNMDSGCTLWHGAVRQLINEVRKLQKEAYWLARHIGQVECHISTIGPDCPNYEVRKPEECKTCWLEVAQGAVKNDK